jgi:P pilus assembly chaperone PapD
LLLKYCMITLRRTGRYIVCVSILLLLLQAAVVTAQNVKSGVTVSYESSGSSRIARFKNSNSYPVRVEFSYQGTKIHGSGDASGQDAVTVAGNYSATYQHPGVSITSVRIIGVMRSD